MQSDLKDMCAFPLRFPRTRVIMPKNGNSASRKQRVQRVQGKGKRVSVTIDPALGFLRGALALRGYRQQILSADIANASTPGFKAVDLDFQQALTQATSAAPPLWLVDDPRDLGVGAPDGAPQAAAAAVKYQTNIPVTLDGNSVDLSAEKVWAAENAVQYEAAASFASQIIKMVTIAINGSGGSGVSSAGGE
ncbi:MAG: flagellar basal body rod protein FlgB [Stellaceae bacterium]